MRFCDVSYFVTLTYDNDNLILADDEPCLDKRDLQLHFKKLRKRLEPRSIKYYAVGEYGDRSGRPHYHYLIFYRGKFDRWKLHLLIKESWTHGLSQVVPIHGAQGYVTKYILKFDKREHLVPPFSMISHGLGLDYLSQSMIDYHRKNFVPYAVKPGGYHVSLPRYYKDRIFNGYQKLILQKRSALYRQEQNLKTLARFDYMMDIGVNLFKEHLEQYQHRLYQSMKLYKEKHKL